MYIEESTQNFLETFDALLGFNVSVERLKLLPPGQWGPPPPPTLGLSPSSYSARPEEMCGETAFPKSFLRLQKVKRSEVFASFHISSDVLRWCKNAIDWITLPPDCVCVFWIHSQVALCDAPEETFLQHAGRCRPIKVCAGPIRGSDPIRGSRRLISTETLFPLWNNSDASY